MPAPGRWSPAPRSCPPARPGSSRGWPTPSCSPRRPASAATSRSCGARSPGRWWSISHEECDRLGMHVANVEALRRAVALLDLPPAYVLTDGFPVDGLGVPGLAVWKGDRVAACISAASVLAKVTRDRIMRELDAEWPAYDFKTHKGYITDVHTAALDRARSVAGAPDAVRERTAGRRPRGLLAGCRSAQRRWGRPKTVRTPLENSTESGGRAGHAGQPGGRHQGVLDVGDPRGAQRPGPCVFGTQRVRPSDRVCRPNRAVRKSSSGRRLGDRLADLDVDAGARAPRDRVAGSGRTWCVRPGPAPRSAGRPTAAPTGRAPRSRAGRRRRRAAGRPRASGRRRRGGRRRRRVEPHVGLEKVPRSDRAAATEAARRPCGTGSADPAAAVVHVWPTPRGAAGRPARDRPRQCRNEMSRHHWLSHLAGEQRRPCTRHVARATRSCAATTRAGSR